MNYKIATIETKISDLISDYEKRISDVDRLIDASKGMLRGDRDNDPVREEIKIYNSRRQCYVQFIENLKELEDKL